MTLRSIDFITNEPENYPSADKIRSVDSLPAFESTYGSWHQDTAATLKHMFGLHLTVRSSNAQIEAALTWLLKHIEIQTNKIQVSAKDVAAVSDLTDLPFVSGRVDMLLTAATLFLCSILNRENDPDDQLHQPK